MVSSDCRKVIVSLDFDSLAEAVGVVSAVKDLGCLFKVGMQLCNKEGTPQTIAAISAAGGPVFLDLKFKDIPNTVAAAVEAVAGQGVFMLNVHCDGGLEMMQSAARAVQGHKRRPLVIGVTVLTSINEQVLTEELRVAGGLIDQVVHLAGLARKAGLDGVVCSPHEIRAVKAACGEEFVTVVPGIRPSWAAPGDQKRFTTPGEAVKLGADYLVIGRPITAPPLEIGTCRDALLKIASELAADPPVR